MDHTTEKPPLELFAGPSRREGPGTRDALRDGPVGEPFVVPGKTRPAIANAVSWWRNANPDYIITVRQYNGQTWALKTRVESSGE